MSIHVYADATDAFDTLWKGMAFLVHLNLSELATYSQLTQDPGRSSSEKKLEQLLGDLVSRLETATGACSLSLSVCIAGVIYNASIGSAVGPLGLPPEREICTSSRLAVPIRASNELVGYIDARKSREPGEFTTEHKAVVRATAGLLGLVVDRLTLQKSQLSLTDRLIKDDRFPAMMYAVWRLANQSKNLEELLLSLVPAVTRAIPSVATVLRLWDHNHVMLRDAETGPGKEVLTLRRILDAEHPATLIRRSVWARRFGGDDWRRDPDGKNDFNNRFAVIMIPLHCTGSLRGVFTLARQGEDAEFTTEEKQALCVVSGLVSSYGQNREVDAA